MAVYLNSDEILYSFFRVKNALNRDDKNYDGKRSALTHCIDLINAQIKIAIQDGEDKYEPVRHGKWVKLKDGSYWCSNCCIADEYKEKYNRCPSCGAKMDLKEED